MNEDEPFKELCAEYGAAMYFAQVLEHGIANALGFLDLIPRTGAQYTPEEHDAYFEDKFAKTLGNLIRKLEAVTTLPDDLKSDLLESKRRRDLLAHRFFRLAADDIQLGRYQLHFDALEDHRAFFHATDRKLDAFVAPVMERYGLTKERLSQVMQEYEAQLRNGL